MAKNKYRFTFYYGNDIATEFPPVEFPTKNAFMAWAKSMGYSKLDYWTYGANGGELKHWMPYMPEKMKEGWDLPFECHVRVTKINN